jgi:murein DD-endopeptidase MepM/ murein hydrolase activator NlpD
VTRAGIAVLLLLAMTVPAFAQSSSEVTPADIEAARQRRAEAVRDLFDITARYEEAVGLEIQTRERVQSLAMSLALLERDLALLRLEATTIVRGMYMEAGNTMVVGLFDATVFTELPMRASYLTLATEQDIKTLNRFESTQLTYLEQQQELDASLAAQEQLVTDIAAAAVEIEATLAAADAEYNAVVARWQRQEEERKRREEEERRRREEEMVRQRAEAAAAAAAATSTTVALAAESTTTTVAAASTTTTTTTAPAETTTTTTTVPQPPPPVTTDGRTCPVAAATTFSDSWGAPRSGGRVHKGVDMIAARGAPIVAIESGVVERITTGSIGGLSIYYRGNSGDRYYYAHLDAFADGITGGVSVDVGGRLGDNGSTGNAPDWLPHLHFQWAPAGSDWVNPYPLVADLCL